ncbi:hypothetical protein [Kluyvera sp. 142486]|uniref:hypothetical protein n=1 Tax=Kluyvera sp. 142486 TaxID=3390050 RepID=UPI00397EADC5
MEINIEDLLLELKEVNGVEQVALINIIKKEVEYEFNLDDNSGPLVQAMSDIVRANIKYARLSSSKNYFEDIMITYSDCIHLLISFSYISNRFIYIGIDKRSNIALTRLKLNECLSIRFSAPML